MADENKINPTSNIDSKQLISAQKEIKQGQGDFNDAIKDSINLLKQLDRSYERIESRLETMNKSTINVKEINQELAKVKQKEFITSKKLSEAEKTISADSKNRVDQYLKSQAKINELEARKIQYLREGNQQSANGVDLLLNQYTGLNERQKNTLNIQETELLGLMKANEIAKESIVYGEDKLIKEKELQKSIGITGGLFSQFSKKLGIGTNVYEAMTKKSRELQDSNEKIGKFTVFKAGLSQIKKDIKESLSDPLVKTALIVGGIAGTMKAVSSGLKTAGGLASQGMSALTGGGGAISGLVSPFTNLIKQIPLVGGLIGGVVDMFANIADYATEAGSQVQLFARNLGLSVADATKLNTQYSNIAHSSGDLLYNSKKFRETQMEISEATGRNNLLSTTALQTQIQLKELAGIDLETRKQLVDVETVSGVQQDKIVKAAMGTSNFISKTLGVSIKWQNILKEASSLSGVLGLSFAKYPEKLTRSLATVKSMGLELKQLDSLADSFLDFESSISKEFEAQLLTGKDINLAKAREAFLNNDLVAAGKELVDQLGTSGEFLNYNRIQQDALAASAGMTRDQVADMLKQQELFSKFQVNDIKAYQQKVALMTQTIEGQKELVSLLGDEEYSKVMSQTATEKIANFIEKIKQSFADLLSSSSFKGFLDKVINFISDPKNIEALLSKITGFISVMIKAVASVLSGLDQLPFVEIDKGIINSIRGYADELSNAKLGSLVSNVEGVSVGANAANSEIKNSQGAVVASPQDNMSMAKSPETKVYVLNQMNAITGKALTVPIEEGMYFAQGGQIGKSTTG